MSSEKKNHNAGHRQRMFEKFGRGNFSPEYMLPHEMLEMFLFLLVPRVNTNHTAHRLLDSFGTLENVFRASVDELEKLRGISTKTALKLCFFGEVFRTLGFDDEN